MPTDLKIDLAISEWQLREQLAYREKVDVNPQYAYAEIVDAFRAGDNSILNIPAEYLLGFVWVTQRRDRAALTWDEVIDEVNYGDLLEAFAEAFAPIVDAAIAEAEEAPRPTKAGKGKKKPAPARTTPSSPSPESS